MPEKERHEEELVRLLEALAESYLHAAPDELREEIEQESRDPEQVAQETRGIILDALRVHGQRKLENARREHYLAVSKFKDVEYALPDTPDEQRQLLAAVIAARPNLRQPLTLQHRDLAELSDEDVRSGLRQLAELGVLEEIQKADESK